MLFYLKEDGTLDIRVPFERWRDFPVDRRAIARDRAQLDRLRKRHKRTTLELHIALIKKMGLIPLCTND